MTDTHRRLVEIVRDGDRRPNTAREMLTIEDCIWAHAQKVGRNGTGRAHQLDS